MSSGRPGDRVGDRVGHALPVGHVMQAPDSLMMVMGVLL